jgi:hypothetical protein
VDHQNRRCTPHSDTLESWLGIFALWTMPERASGASKLEKQYKIEIRFWKKNRMKNKKRAGVSLKIVNVAFKHVVRQ